jgi:hypothetical protein
MMLQHLNGFSAEQARSLEPHDVEAEEEHEDVRAAVQGEARPSEQEAVRDHDGRDRQASRDHLSFHVHASDAGPLHGAPGARPRLEFRQAERFPVVGQVAQRFLDDGRGGDVGERVAAEGGEAVSVGQLPIRKELRELFQHAVDAVGARLVGRPALPRAPEDGGVVDLPGRKQRPLLAKHDPEDGWRQPEALRQSSPDGLGVSDAFDEHADDSIVARDERAKARCSEMRLDLVQ